MNYFSDVADTKVSSGSSSVKRKYTNQIPGNFLIRVDRCKLIKKDEGMGLPAVVMEGQIVQHENSDLVGIHIQEMADRGKEQKKFFNEIAKRLAAIDLMLQGTTEEYNPNADLDGDVWNDAIGRVFGGHDEKGKADGDHTSSIKGVIIRYANNEMKDKDTGEVIEGRHWANQLGPVTPDQLVEELDPKEVEGIHPAYLG